MVDAVHDTTALGDFRHLAHLKAHGRALLELAHNTTAPLRVPMEVVIETATAAAVSSFQLIMLWRGASNEGHAVSTNKKQMIRGTFVKE